MVVGGLIQEGVRGGARDAMTVASKYFPGVLPYLSSGV